ncbi:MAG: HEPN domain-containing protein [Thermoflexales bacterium]|nr:HEPN domain-containing protein [Thermoflexales bacterium]
MSTPWPPVRVNGTELQATSEAHYRKLLALQRFVDRVLSSPVRPYVAKVVLFGSVATGDPHPDSDVDILLVGTERIRDIEFHSSEAAYSVLLETGEVCQPVVSSMGRWQVGDSCFLREVSQTGKEVYTMDAEQLAYRTAQNLYLLAGEYLQVAERLLAEGAVRVAVDVAYNAAELCAKAFLMGKVERTPSRHGSIVQKFSEIYILREQRFPPTLGHRLHQALNYRHDARYIYEAIVTDEMAREVLTLAREMHEHLRQYLLEVADEQEDRP